MCSLGRRRVRRLHIVSGDCRRCRPSKPRSTGRRRLPDDAVRAATVSSERRRPIEASPAFRTLQARRLRLPSQRRPSTTDRLGLLGWGHLLIPPLEAAGKWINYHIGRSEASLSTSRRSSVARRSSRRRGGYRRGTKWKTSLKGMPSGVRPSSRHADCSNSSTQSSAVGSSCPISA
jgi:hypothetical protein